MLPTYLRVEFPQSFLTDSSTMAAAVGTTGSRLVGLDIETNFQRGGTDTCLDQINFFEK